VSLSSLDWWLFPEANCVACKFELPPLLAYEWQILVGILNRKVRLIHWRQIESWHAKQRRYLDAFLTDCPNMSVELQVECRKTSMYTCWGTQTTMALFARSQMPILLWTGAVSSRRSDWCLVRGVLSRAAIAGGLGVASYRRDRLCFEVRLDASKSPGQKTSRDVR